MQSTDIALLSQLEVIDENSKKVKLGDFWRMEKVLLVFLRHFACIACRAHAVKVWKDREKYQKQGTKIVFISNGAPHFIKGFRDELNIKDAPVYTDPSLETFRLCGFKRSAIATLSPKSVVNATKLFVEGHRQGSMAGEVGDYWQLGGVLEVHPGNRVAFHYVSQCTGDYPKE